MRSWLLACVSVVGCTAANPNYVGNTQQSLDLAGVGVGGGGGAHDLASGGDAHDLASGGDAHDMAAQCGGSERHCVQTPSPTSVACTNGALEKDRVCPFGSSNNSGAACTNGYCSRPTTNGTTGCGTNGPLEQICQQMSGGGGPQSFSCQPFVSGTSTAVEWWCAIAAVKGPGVAGSACTKDGDCRTGFCASNGTCFWACQNTGECLSPSLQCRAVTITVEHTTVHASSCAP